MLASRAASYLLGTFGRRIDEGEICPFLVCSIKPKRNGIPTLTTLGLSSPRRSCQSLRCLDQVNHTTYACLAYIHSQSKSRCGFPRTALRQN